MRVSKSWLKIVLICVVIAGLWLGSSEGGHGFLSRLAPKTLAGKVPAPVPAPAPQAHSLKQSPAVAPAPLPADTVWTFRDASGTQTYAVALDELYVPVGSGKQRVHSLPSQPNLASLLAVARTLSAQTGIQPELVLYPLTGPRDEFSRRIVTMKIQVETGDLAAVKAAAASLGLSAWQVPDYAPSHAIAQVEGDPAAPLRVVARLSDMPSVRSATPLLARQHGKRTLSQPTDTWFTQQWHLKNIGQQGGITGMDINVTPVWPAHNGAGVAIGIVDDGLQTTHPDLSANVAVTGNHDWNGDDDDPSPDLAEDFHGTAVAGLAAARDNGFGVVGVAPESTLYGLRLIALPTTDQQDAEAMAWKNDVIQIKNNSWGPADDTPEVLGTAGPLWQSAVADGSANGRGGLGTIYVFAAGNGKANGDQGTKDAYAGDMHVVAVGAVTDQGLSSSFGEGGPHLVVSAPGSATVGIITTDLVGADGYNDGATDGNLADADYTDAFSGTSAAAPLVSGVIALMLETNPNLGWRDVKEILLRSSKKIQPLDTDWVARDGGRPDLPPIKHHPFYGGGLVDAQAATVLARDWTNLGSETVLTTSTSTSQNIPDDGAAILIPLDLGSATTLRVEHVELTLNITHPCRGDLEIKLVSPGGTVSTFASPAAADIGADYINWTFTAVRHWGEISQGQWMLSIRDTATDNVGQFLSATLKVHGTVMPTPGVNAPSQFSTRLGSTVTLPLASDGGTYTYRYTGLPKGLKYDTSTGAIIGRTKTTGTFPLVLTVTGTGGLATTLHISLVINPLPFSLLGTYSGFVDRDAGLGQNLGGSLTFATTSSGSLTGRLILDSHAYPFKGYLDGDSGAPATITLDIPRRGQTPVALRLSIPADNSDAPATGTLNASVPVTAWHKGFTTLPYAGRHTFALETPAGAGWPAGYSTGTIIATSAGIAQWTLQPADGTAALKGSTTISADGKVALFAQVKTPGGSFLGALTLPPYTTPGAHLDGTVSWLRGATSSNAYANPAGFGPLALTVHGGRYVAPSAGKLVLDLPAVADNANLTCAGTDVDLGAQAAFLDPFVITLNSQNKVVTPKPGPDNPVSLKVSINPATGQFQGSFTLTDPVPPATVQRHEKFSGVFLLQDGVGAGFFVLPALPGSANGTRSGSVVFVLAP